MIRIPVIYTYQVSSRSASGNPVNQFTLSDVVYHSLQKLELDEIRLACRLSGSDCGHVLSGPAGDIYYDPKTQCFLSMDPRSHVVAGQSLQDIFLGNAAVWGFRHRSAPISHRFRHNQFSFSLPLDDSFRFFGNYRKLNKQHFSTDREDVLESLQNAAENLVVVGDRLMTRIKEPRLRLDFDNTDPIAISLQPQHGSDTEVSQSYPLTELDNAVEHYRKGSASIYTPSFSVEILAPELFNRSTPFPAKGKI